MKILVRGTNWIGDAVMSVPALRMLRASFPDAHISLLTRSWAEGIFRDSELVDEILSFEKSQSKINDLRRQTSLLRGAGFDSAVLFTNSFESALVARLAGIPRRLGYATDARRLLLTDALAVPEWKETRHEAHYYLELVSEFAERMTGARPDSVEAPLPDLMVSEERKIAARMILAQSGADLSGKVVALGVGSTNSRAKRWPAVHFAELADELHGRLGASVVLVGSPDESDVAEEVRSLSKSKPISLVGKTGLGEAVALLSSVQAMVSNDMGLAHISAGVGTPTLTLFGPTKDTTTRPLGRASYTLRHQVECSPCMLRDCPIDHRCMRDLTTATVLTKVETMLGEG